MNVDGSEVELVAGKRVDTCGEAVVEDIKSLDLAMVSGGARGHMS